MHSTTPGTIQHQTTESGFVALMATIVIAAVLLVMSVEGSIAGWNARFNVLGTEAKEQAQALAQGCADQALSAIVTDPSYDGDATTTTAVGTCHVFPIEFNVPIEGVVTIRTQAVVRDSYANLEMQMDMSEIHIDSIPEEPTRGTIIVITNVVNDGEGTSVPGDFTMHVTGGSPSLTSFAGSETGVVVTVAPGGYGVTGDNESGYSMSVSTNCSGSVSPGAIKFCTVTYNDITTTLTLLVNVVNNDGGTLDYTDFPIYIDGTSVTPGRAYSVTPGNHTASADAVSDYTASVWGYQCSNGGSVTVNEGQNKTCIINFNDNEAPTPDCADTVMILDRTGSMSSADLANERVAAISLTDLYAGVSPPADPPHLGVGSIGGLNGSAASIPTLGQLSTVYANIRSAITSITGSNSSVGTNLAAGITTASDELNGPRHVAGNEKVLVLVSDGEPNRPTDSQSTDTGFLSPASSAQESVSSVWANATEAYADGGSAASAAVSGSANRERYYTFGIGGGSGLPSGATINGIQTKVDAWATAAGMTNTPGNDSEAPGSTIAPNQWTNPTNAYTSNNAYATNATNGNQQGYGNFGLSIPANATITGIEVDTEARIGASATTLLYDSFGSGSTDGTFNEAPAWTENNPGGEKRAQGSGNDSPSADGNRFATLFNDGWICQSINASGLSNLQLSYYWRGDADVNWWENDDGVVEYHTSGGGASCTSPSGWYQLQNHNLNQDSSWSTQSAFSLPSSLNNTTFFIRFRANSDTNEYFRVDGITLTSTPSVTGSLSVALSSNNGGSYTSAKSVSLTSTETVSSPSGNSATDMWGRGWVPGDFADGGFALRVTNTSASGPTVSLDQVVVTVNYTVPTPVGTACQIGVDLSWNGGTSWTSEKTQTITNTETTYTLGASNDDWRSGSWAPADFSNTNLRARVRAIDPGSGCDNAATEYMDWFQLKVFYTQTTDPVEAALDAADSAKSNGVNIFTIHFGTDPSGYTGRELLANLASGDDEITTSPHNTHGHQDGSYADPDGVTTGNTGNISPTAQAATTGGDGNGYETNPTNAYADGGGYASNANGAGDRHIYSGYGITLPPGATITGIATRLDWWVESTSGNNSMSIELSWNGGTNWTSAKSATNESTNPSNSETEGGSSDTWGRSWAADDFSSANFRVRVTANCNNSGSCSSRDFYLDWIPVTVYYSVNTENSDDDNFFISPTSADMRDIFDFIGKEVCPVVGYAEPVEPPTTGQITVVTNVVNNNGGSLTSDAVDFTVTPGSASPNSFAGSDSGVIVTLNPGSYSVTSDEIPDGYTEIIGAGCSSDEADDIVAGEVRVCVITYDDVPPPPPAPDLTIHLGSWKELPVAE